MDDIWLTFDSAVAAYYSSRNVPLQQSRLVEGIGEMFRNLESCQCLTFPQCEDFYIWITEHFINMLLDQNSVVSHQSIVKSYEILFTLLSKENVTICNQILDNLLNLIERVIEPLYSWENKPAFVVTFNHDNLTIPDGVKNIINQVEISSDSTLSSLLSCFIYIMRNNYKTVARFGGCTHHRIMLLLIRNASHSTEITTKSTALLLISKFSTEAFPIFTFEEWMDVYYCLTFLENPGNATSAELVDVFDSFGVLLEQIVSSGGTRFSKIDYLLLTTVLKVLVELCRADSTDVRRWAKITSSFMTLVPSSFSSSLKISDLVEYSHSDEVLSSVFQEYFYKYAEHHQLMSEADSSPLVFRKVNDVWNNFLQQIYYFFKSFPNFNVAQLRNQVEHITKIVSIPERLKSLEVKYNRKFIFYDIIKPGMLGNVLSFFIEMSGNLSDEDCSNLLRLIVQSLGILEESNNFNIDVYYLLLLPWNNIRGAGRKLLFDNEIKLACFRGLCYLTTFIPETQSSVVINVLNTLHTIYAKEKHLAEFFIHLLLVILLTKSNSGVLKICYNYIEQYINHENINSLILSDKLGEKLPCIFANRCVLEREGSDRIMSCLDCDKQNVSTEKNVLHLDHYLDVIGFVLVKNFLQGNNQVKHHLLKNLRRYILHCKAIRNLETISLISEVVCKFMPDLSNGCSKMFSNLMLNKEDKFDIKFARIILSNIRKTYFMLNEDQKDNWAKNLCNLLLEIPWSSSSIPEKNLLLLPVLRDFIVYILSSKDNKNYLKHKLDIISKHHGFTMKQLLILHEEELSKIWVEIVTHNIQKKIGNVRFTITQIAEIFGFKARDFLEYRCLPFMVSYILTTYNKKQRSYLLSELAAVLMTTEKNLIAHNFEIIFTSIYFLDDEETVDNAFTIIEELCENNLETLIYFSYKTLICNVLLNANKPLKMLRFFQKHIERDSFNFVKEVLMQNIIGFLTFVDAKLLSKTTSFLTKKKCLTALPYLMTLIGGENVNNIRIKLLATLRTGLPPFYDVFPKESLKVWMYFLYSTLEHTSSSTFVETGITRSLNCRGTPHHVLAIVDCSDLFMKKLLNIDNSQLAIVAWDYKLNITYWTGFIGPFTSSIFTYFINLKVMGEYLTSIFSLLLPLYQQFPEDVGNIFYYLVVQNGHLYTEYLPELYFVMDSTDEKMHQVWLTIETASKPNSTITCFEEIQRTLKHIRNENVESRVHCLRFLHQQLKLYGPNLHKLIVRNDRLAPFIKEIVHCLMINIHSGNSEVKLLCGACLGELGAVNPARFGYRYTSGSSKSTYHPVESDEFAFLCISEMTKGLQKAENSHKFNTIASCIQEILKYYFPENRSSNRGAFLEKFPHNEKDILQSLLETRYIFTEPAIPEGIHIGSHADKTSFEWASNWASELITFIPSDSFSSRLFKFCLPSILLDSQILEALLPYILLQAIVSYNEYHNVIEKEMKFILKWKKEEHRINLPTKISLCKMIPKKNNVVNSFSTNSKCSAIVLDLLDFLFKSLTDLCKSDLLSMDYNLLQSFLSYFSSSELSLKSYNQGDFCRSLFHYEKGIDQLQSDEVNTAPLRNIYAKLHDADGLLGVIRTSPRLLNIEDSVLNHIVCGNIQDAVVGYEKLSMEFSSTECHRGLIQCFLNINEPYVALKVSDAFLKQCEFVDSSFYNEYCEAICQTMMIYDLPPVLDCLNSRIDQNWSWSVDIAQIYLDLFNLNFMAVNTKIDSVRQFIVGSLASISNTSIGAYRQGYDHIVKLHILNDLEKYGSLIQLVGRGEQPQPEVIADFLGNLNMDLRPDLLPSNSYFRQTVLNSRQQVLMIAKTLINKLSPNVEQLIDSELGKTWLKLVQIARKNGNFHNAHSCMAIAENYNPVGLFIEKAKLHKARHETDSAVLVLNQGIQQFFSDISQTQDLSVRMMCAEAKLLIARYNDVNMNVDFFEGCKYYSAAVEICSTEKNFVLLAQYLYKRFCSESQPDDTSEKRDVQVQAVYNFGKSLFYGCKYIYQSMPCMLSLWLDYGMRFHKEKPPVSLLQQEEISMQKEVMRKLDEIMENNFVILPTYMFMTAFSQLLSRINHPLESCLVILRKIITEIVLTYPQQAFWMFAPIIKSADPGHKKECQIILQEIYVRKPELHVFCKTFIEFIDSLINVCNKKVPREIVHVPLKALSRSLISLLQNQSVQIMIPAQRFRTMYLPNYKHFETEKAKMEQNVFPLNMVYFHSVEETVQLLPSLQRPKKLLFIGSDGLRYPFMCKPMDDLRLDSRIMEFCSVVNMYLRRDPASRDRNLHIRTYSVVPINHECGLIEWLPNLMGFRKILFQMYRGSQMSSHDLKAKFEGVKLLPQKLALFNDILLPKHPPVLQKWFFQQYPSPDMWYHARQSFVRTTAVMSVVGYVVGLGDRHGDNILIDTTTGDLVHVDFNCLFNKGEQFLYPEVVPFRLTHNMVHAMGPTGIEGSFMKCCEITNRVVRNHSQQLVSVVKPFLYDPRSQNRSAEEGSVDKVKKNIMNVQKRLNGIVLTYTKETQPLSVEGQMRGLVEEATSPANLCRMFMGWAPYL